MEKKLLGSTNFQFFPVNIDEYKVSEDLVLEQSRELLREFTCSICSFVLLNPQACKSCEQMFCKKCIESCLAVKCTCPLCIESYKPSNVNRVVLNILGNIMLRCPAKCTEELRYSDLKNHLNSCSKIELTAKCNHCLKIFKDNTNLLLSKKHESECPEIKVKCPLSECKEMVKRINITNHNENCKFRLIICGDCNNYYQSHLFGNHIPKECIKNIKATYRCKYFYYNLDEISLKESYIRTTEEKNLNFANTIQKLRDDQEKSNRN